MKMTNHNIALMVARASKTLATELNYTKDVVSGEERLDDNALALFESNPTIANEFISTMSNQIVAQYAYDIFRDFDMPFNSFMKSMSKLGDAEMYLTNELTDDEEYDDTERDPFDADKPTIINNFIKTEEKRIKGVRISEEIWRGAFVTENGLSNIVGIVLKNVRDSIELFIYDKLCALVSDTTKFTKYETIETISAKGETAKAQKAYEQIMALVNRMILPSDAYNTLGKKTITPKGRLCLFLNADYKASFDINVLASLFNSSNIELSKYFKEVRVINFPSSAPKQVGFVCDDEAFMWGYRIDTTMSIVNPRTMEIVTWSHRWIKYGTIPTRNAVRLMTA